MMATPLNAEEIITGEIFWGATKAAIGTTIMLTVISFFGLVSYPSGILIILAAFLGGIALVPWACFYQRGKNNRVVQPADFFIGYPDVSFQRHFFSVNQPAFMGAIFCSDFTAYSFGQPCPGIEFWLIQLRVIDQFMLFNCFLPHHVPSRSFQNAPQTD